MMLNLKHFNHIYLHSIAYFELTIMKMHSRKKKLIMSIVNKYLEFLWLPSKVASRLAKNVIFFLLDFLVFIFCIKVSVQRENERKRERETTKSARRNWNRIEAGSCPPSLLFQVRCQKDCICQTSVTLWMKFRI